ncbi:hypothetical protein REB14_15790 [Chryseobacterium sp. ES2]|uniref:Uncharacterized protein n=1 Tax=Chryseobacterium metallicongregator TaxID=3073042 RepID=A0ABU1E7B7_9FLAO|nr:hypothetical protein [Chryseobacterium sp. ES2]MDR4953640.1 hypothetical protein [Chryseobacterium sp. ES2]
MNNKQKVAELLKSIEADAAEPISYINGDKYKQHNLAFGYGLAGFCEILQMLPLNSAKVNTVRIFEDGNYIFSHIDYIFFGQK